MGWILFYAGMDKLLDPNWTSGQLLSEAASKPIPLADLWGVLSPEWLWLVDPLNIWGEILIGLCLIFGALVRLASFLGIVLMILYYFAHLPLDWGFVIDFHIVYVMILFGLAAFGSGRILGLDYYVENSFSLPSWSKYLLG